MPAAALCRAWAVVSEEVVIPVAGGLGAMWRTNK